MIDQNEKMSRPGDFNTGGIRFVEDSYEKYLKSVVKVMEENFPNGDTEWLRVPPVYREQVIAHLEKHYPQCKIGKYEISGIFVKGDASVCLRHAIRRVNSGDGLIKTDHLEEVCDGLRKAFPSRKFEIQDDSEIYAGTTWMREERKGRQIVVDDFEFQGKWGPNGHRTGDLEWLLEEALEDIKVGHKVFDSNRDQELAEALRNALPGHTFELKRHDDVFPWNMRSKKYCDGPEYETVVIMDGFIPPPPKKYQKPVIEEKPSLLARVAGMFF